MEQITKKQHFVPEFYFKNFYGSNKKVCDYELKHKSYSYKTAGQICYKHFLYETPWENNQGALGDFVQTNSIENHFRDRESVYRPLVNKVIENLSNNGDLFLNWDELNVIAEFVSNLFFRNPAIIRMSNVDKLTDEDYKIKGVNEIKFLIEMTGVGELDPILKAAKYHELVDDSLKGSYPDKMKQLLKSMRLTFLIAQESNFITSNQPVAVKVDDKGDLQSLFLPISPKISLTYNPIGIIKNVVKLPPFVVYSINKIYLNDCRTGITNLYAQNKKDIENVLKFRGEIND